MAEVAKGIIEVEINTGSSSAELKGLLSQINAFQLALNKGNASQAAFSKKYSKDLQDSINKTGTFTAETVRLQTAAVTLDKTLSKGKTSLGQFFSAKYNKNSAIAAETMALAAERARRLQTQFIATSSAANGFQDALAVRPLAAFSTQAAIAGQKAQIMSAMFKQGTTQLINFGKNVQWAGRQLMVGFTVPLTIFGAVAGKTFMQLEKEVVSFKKVYGDLFTTPADLEKNLEAVKGLAAEYTKYGIAVKDTIGLAAEAAAAGRQGSELTDTVSQSTRLATLGQMDQNAALETTISLQSAFKLSGQELADTVNFLNMVENQTVVSLQDIATAIPRVAPVIQGLGGDVKDLTVFLAAMQEGGVQASEGANALKSGLASLINPTKQASAMLSGMGINLDAIIQANKGDLMGTVTSFSEALATLDQFSKQQALEQVFGKFQYAKLGALFENITREGSQAQQVIATLGYTTEQLAATADKELKTIEESFGVQLTGAVERFKLAIAPIGELFVKLAIPLVNFATKIAEAFNGLSDGQKKFAAIGAVIVGVVVPAVTMLTGLFLNLVGTLAKMTQGVSLFGMGLIRGGPLGAVKALTQSSKYLSLAEMDTAMAAQQLSGANAILNATLVEQAITGNAAAAAMGNLTKSYAAMISTQAAAAGLPAFTVAGAAGARAKASQVVVRGLQKRNSGGPIFMSDGTTVPGMGNTDTVPAMLTPGEFVVNKEATKNNLGLLHNINDSKSPQGLNSGGKVNGMQYLSAGAVVRAARAATKAGNLSKAREEAAQMMEFLRGGMGTERQILQSKTFSSLAKAEFKKLLNPRANAASLNSSSQVVENISKIATREVSKNSSRLPRSFANQIILKRKLERAKFGGANQPGTGGSSGRSGSSKRPAIGPAPGERGYSSYSKADIGRIIGPEFDRFGGKKAKAALLSKLFEKNGNPSKFIFGHAGTPEYLQHARKIGLQMPGNKNAYPRGTVSQLEEKLYNFTSKDIEENVMLDVLPKTGSIIPRSTNTPMSRGSGANKSLFENPQWYDELELIDFLKKQEVPIKKIREITGRVVANKKKLISESEIISEARWGQIQKEAEEAAFLYLNSGGQVPGYNEGNIVPGMGNTDTVPAMLTPGEFVVNKESTKKNYDLLNAINGSQKLNSGGMAGGVQYLADGKLVGKVPGALGLAGFFAGQPIAKAAGVDNEMAGMAAGFAAQAAASKIAKKALLKFGYITEEAAGKTGMLTKVLGKVGLTSTKLIPVIGWIVTAGITVKALNDSLIKAENAGGELSKAMYGSADRVRKMGEAFGRESFSTQAAKLSAERVAGQIPQEAKQASSQYMGSESGKQLLADIELVKKQGGDAVTALRNQLAQSVVAGVLTPDEAKAIAVDIGTAMNDQYITLNAAADLNTLLGPNGENLLKDPLKIVADISPKIDVNAISAQASKAYADSNPLQKVTAFLKNEDFEKQFSIKKISDENATALENEAQARGLLNYQYQSGSITLQDYIGKLEKLQGLSNKNAKLSGDAQASILGYKDSKAMSDAAIAYNSKSNEKLVSGGKGGTGVVKISQEGKDASNLFKQSEKNAKEFIDTLKLSDEVSKSITASLQNLSKTDPTIFDKFISGQYQSQNLEFSIKLSEDGVSPEELDKINMQLGVLQNFPNVSKLIDINNKGLGADDIKEVYDFYVAFDKNPDIFKGINVKDNFMGPLKQAGVAWADFAAMPNETKYAILTYVTVRQDIVGKGATNNVAESHGGKDMEDVQKKIDDLAAAGKAAADALASDFNTMNDSVGSGGQDLLKMLIERFKLQEMLIDKEAEGYNDRIKQLNREIELEQRQVELRQKGLEELAKKEDAVNDAYNLRVDALDKVSESNSRIGEQEKSRISLASALASGDIASAASITSEMQQQSAQYQIEDAKAALEKQRQVDLDALTVSINGKLMTRKGIESEIEAIQDRVYNKGIEIQGIQDTLIGFENRKLEVAKQREIVETRMYLMEQKKAINALNALKAKNKLTKEDQAALADYKASYNLFASFIGMPTLKKYGGSIAKMAYGGFAHKGSREAPPALRMNNGSTVPGTGITDKVSALLTPGEFVVRKPVADKNRGFLEALNGQVFPGMGGRKSVPTNNFLDGIGSPRYSVPSSGVSNIPVANTNVVSTSSPMYNSTYNVNVNVSGTNASPDDIANVVMAKLSQQNRGNLRSNRY